MKITVAGQDLTPKIGPAIEQIAARLKKLEGRAAPSRIPQEISALALHQSRSDSDYLDHYVRLLRYRDAFDTYDFHIPRRPGPVGFVMAKIKKALWKFLRYQFDRIAFRQNLINNLFANAIEFELAEMKRINSELVRRIEQLEVLRSKPHDPSSD